MKIAVVDVNKIARRQRNGYNYDANPDFLNVVNQALQLGAGKALSIQLGRHQAKLWSHALWVRRNTLGLVGRKRGDYLYVTRLGSTESVTIPPAEMEKTIPCPECNKLFASGAHLRMHRVTHLDLLKQVTSNTQQEMI